MTDLPPAAPSPMLDGDEDLRPRWPKVIGIISIVWAGLGLTCGGCGIVFLAFMPQLMKSAEATLGPMPPPMTPPPLQIMVAGVSLVWALVLLTGGIMLVSRKPAARPVHLVYAAVGIVLTLVNTYFSIQQQGAIAEWMRQNPDSKWAQQNSPAGQMIGLAFGLLLGLGWPLFCLVWFGVVKRDSLEIAKGVEEQVA